MMSVVNAVLRADADALYRRHRVERAASVGGRLVFSGLARHLVLGQVEKRWDEVLIVAFPAKEAFVEIVNLKNRTLDTVRR